MAAQTLSPSRGRRLRVPRDAAAGYLMLLPAAILIVLLVAYPVSQAVVFSFQKKLIGSPDAPFVGLANYQSLLNDRLFWQSVRNVFTFTISSVAIKLVLGTTVAVILNETLPMRGLIRSIVLLPWALPTLVSVLIWTWMYSDVAGVLSYILMSLGLVSKPVLFLSDPVLAMVSVIVVNVWRGFPFYSVTILAGLQTIPEELYDAAKIDGAGMAARFRHVTLPGAAPVMAVVTLLSTIWTFNDFTIIWLLTRGGPGNATDVLSTITYKYAVRGLEMGKGVAVSVLMLPILLVLIILLSRFISQREETA